MYDIPRDMPEPIVKPEIRLRPIEREDLPLLQLWRNHLKAYFREYRDLNMEHQRQWFESLTNDRRTMMWVIEVVGEGRSIGVCGWTYIDWLNRHAELSIYIGRDDYRGKGYGTAVLAEMHRIAFDELGLHRVYLEVYDYNPAKHLYERAGYKHCGVWRQHHFHEGQFHDSILMDLLADEWRAAQDGATRVTVINPPESVTAGGPI